MRIGVSAVSMDGKSESAIAWGAYQTVPANSIVEGFSIDKSIIKANEEFTVAFDDPNHSAATWVIKSSENDAVKGTFNAASFTTSLAEEGIYDLYLTMNGATEVYRGKIQISPAEVGATPEIKTFTMTTESGKASPEVNETVTFNYTGRPNSDGSVSRGIALGEKAFGIPANQLNFNDNTPFTLTFWMYVNRYNHASSGTQFLNIRTASDQWPESDWGYIWSTINPAGGTNPEGSMSLYYRDATINGGIEVPVSSEFQFKPETWYHIVLVMGYTSNRTLALYINGKLVSEATVPSNKKIYTWKSSNVIMIGGNAFSRAGIDGTLDEVRLYKKALNATEVKATMQHTEDVSDANFIGYWDFESEANENNNVISTGYNKSLIAGLYEITTISEGNNQYLPKPINYAAGAPFIPGSNYQVVTTPQWVMTGAKVVSASGNETEGSAVASYEKEGKFNVTLTLSNSWGSDTKTISGIEVYPTGIEDVTLEEMQAFPNPFENEVYVKFVEAGNYTIELYDYTGRLINSAALNASEGEIVNIPVEGQSGIYFLKVKGEAGLLNVMKVVKK